MRERQRGKRGRGRGQGERGQSERGQSGGEGEINIDISIIYYGMPKYNMVRI